MSIKKYTELTRQKLKTQNPTQKQKNQHESHRGRVERGRKQVYDEFMRRGGCCQFCGIEERFEIYEWHHVNDMDPKNKRIGTYVGQHPSAMKLQAELYKCVVLCPNCHRKFHHDLCCMLEHRQQHIDGTYFSTEYDGPEPEPEPTPLELLLNHGHKETPS